MSIPDTDPRIPGLEFIKQHLEKEITERKDKISNLQNELKMQQMLLVTADAAIKSASRQFDDMAKDRIVEAKAVPEKEAPKNTNSEIKQEMTKEERFKDALMRLGPHVEDLTRELQTSRNHFYSYWKTISPKKTPTEYYEKHRAQTTA